MKHTTDLMTSIIKSEICEVNSCLADSFVLSEDESRKLCFLSRKHDVAHIVGNFLLKNKVALPDEVKTFFEKITFQTLRRHELLCYELESICQILDELKVKHMPLKGSIIRNIYPEPWMRSSCDIDILVPEEQAESVVNTLVERYGYKKTTENTHDISTISPQGICVEIHYALVEKSTANNSSEILKSVWDYCTPDKASPYRFYMNDEMLYFYHIAHMAKHFENGGCGVRPFLDIYFLDRLNDVDVSKRNALLEKGELLKFADMSRKLSNIWFSNAEHDELSLMFEDFIIRGGSFGTNTNRVNVQQNKKGGKIKFALSKIFTPYDRLKHFYPIIKKHKWLTPFMQVRRWGKLIFCGHAKRSVNELKYSNNISENDAAIMSKFLNDIGL